MTERPAAEFHADRIDVHMTTDGTVAMLTLVNPTQGLSVTLPRWGLKLLRDRISEVLLSHEGQ